MSTTATQNGVDELAGAHQLSAADRCDSCGAQAYIRVVVNSGEPPLLLAPRQEVPGEALEHRAELARRVRAALRGAAPLSHDERTVRR